MLCFFSLPQEETEDSSGCEEKLRKPLDHRWTV